MITHRMSRPAETGKRHHRRALSVAAGLLCLCAFSPSAMTATLTGSTGPGEVTSTLGSGPNVTDFAYNFGGFDGLNVVEWDSSVGGDELFEINLSLTTAPALSSSLNANPDTGLGMLRIRWTRDPILAAGEPADGDWNDTLFGIVSCAFGCSVSLSEPSKRGVDFYEVLLEFNNPASAGLATIDWDWINFNSTGEFIGGPFTIELEPGYVPVPPALWLFGSGLLAVAGISRRRSEKGAPTATRRAAGGAR